jgi:hypothetical protein
VVKDGEDDVKDDYTKIDKGKKKRRQYPAAMSPQPTLSY